LGEKIRETGKEYGATTGRPRRVGWLDLVALKYAIKINGAKFIAMSKIDILKNVNELKVCVAYEHEKSEIKDFYKALPLMDSVKPVYIDLKPIYKEEFNSKELPRNAQDFVDFVANELKVNVELMSYGEERSQTIAI
jgi:adenylosuccinate synthase